MRPPPSSEQVRRHAEGRCAAPGCDKMPKINPTTGVAYWLCRSCATKTLRTKRQLIRENRRK